MQQDISNPYSIAHNLAKASTGHVNPRTGSLLLSIATPHLKGINKAMDIALQLNYQQDLITEGVSIFGLPIGWSFPISYILGNRISINGQEVYELDLNTANHSGLKYYKKKNCKLNTTPSSDPISLPYDPDLKYLYKLSFLDGQNQYFDALGKCIAIDDRFGNHIIYHYDHPQKQIDQARLSTIVDSYQQKIKFTYSDTDIKVSFPKNSTNSIEFSFQINQGSIVSYTNPLNLQTQFTYGPGQEGDHLLKNISYPDGTTYSYEYGAIPYNTGASIQHKDVVSLVTIKSGQEIRATKYNYDPLGNNHNYLGHNSVEVSSTSDALIESHHWKYYYYTSIDNGIHKTILQYNYLHLLLSKNIYASSQSSLKIQEETYNYESEAGNDHYFPIYRNLAPYFRLPVQILKKVYEGDNIRISRQNFTYNDSGQKTLEKTYLPVLRGTPSTLVLSKEFVYNSKFGLVVQQQVSDYKPEGVIQQNPKISVTQNNLNEQNTAIQNSKIGYIIKGQFQPEKTTQLTYDSQGRITQSLSEWASSNHSLPGPTKTGYKMAYNINHNKQELAVVKTDYEGNSTQHIYNLCTGFLSRITNALNHSITYQYDNLGRKTSKTTPSGNVLKWSYDNLQNKVTQIYKNGYEHYSYYNGFKQLIQHSDNQQPRSKERILLKKTYNNLGQLVIESGILGNHLRKIYAYDKRGLLASETDAIGNITTYAYDLVEKQKETSFNGVKTSQQYFDFKDNYLSHTIYSSHSNPLQEGTGITQEAFHTGIGLEAKSILFNPQAPNANSITTTKAYDISHRIINKSISGWDGSQYKASYLRDLLGKLTQVHKELTQGGTSDKKSGSIYEHNTLGQLIQATNPIHQTKQYAYDAVGNLITQSNYEGKDIQYTYTLDNQVATKAYLDNNGEHWEIRYQYLDGINLVKSIETLKGGTLQAKLLYEYTQDHKLKSVTYPDGKNLSWEYDVAKNQLQAFIDATGLKTEYAYDDYGRLVTLSNHHLQEAIQFTYYDKEMSPANSGQISQINYSNGIKIGYNYNGYNHIKSIKVVSSNHGPLLTINYVYDTPLQNITSISYHSETPILSGLNHEIQYQYNGVDQLVLSTTKRLDGTLISEITYEYDAANNIISKQEHDGQHNRISSYTYDPDNKLTSINSNDLQQHLNYDENGNLIDDGAGNTYVYNTLNQLVEHHSEHNGHTIYTYYPNGLRASKQTNDDAPIHFYYDHQKNANIVNEIQGEHFAAYLMYHQERYIRFVSDGTHVQKECLVQDQKSIVLAYNEQHQIYSPYLYDAYGKGHFPKQAESGLLINPFRYNKEYFDNESGLYYLRARYYDPRIMRYTTRDSIQIFNHYNFANGNPVMHTDPSGHISKWWGIGMIIAGAALAVVTVAIGIGIAIAAFLTGGAAAPAEAVEVPLLEATGDIEMTGIAAASATSAASATGAGESAGAVGADAAAAASGAEMGGASTAGGTDAIEGASTPAITLTDESGVTTSDDAGVVLNDDPATALSRKENAQLQVARVSARATREAAQIGARASENTARISARATVRAAQINAQATISAARFTTTRLLIGGSLGLAGTTAVGLMAGGTTFLVKSLEKKA